MIFENPKVILRSKWTLVRVVGLSKTQIMAKNLHLDLKGNNFKQVLEYYDNLIENGNTNTFAFLRTLICGKNITGISKKGNLITLSFEEEPMFFNKVPKVKIALNTPEIENKKDELVSAMVHNYRDSRMQFLDYSLKDENANYIVNAKSKATSYENKNNRYIFNLININEDISNLDEEAFLCEMIDEILCISNDLCDCSYSTTGVANKPLDYVRNVIINVGTRRIMIDIINQETLDYIVNNIEKHNEKINEEHVKRYKRKGE